MVAANLLKLELNWKELVTITFSSNGTFISGNISTPGNNGTFEFRDEVIILYFSGVEVQGVLIIRKWIIKHLLNLEEIAMGGKSIIFTK